LHAKIILLFTTGETALSLSKLHAPCPIVAVTAKKHVARNLNLVNGVIPYLVGSLYGIES
jgi:pyruvate kinase